MIIQVQLDEWTNAYNDTYVVANLYTSDRRHMALGLALAPRRVTTPKEATRAVLDAFEKLPAWAVPTGGYYDQYQYVQREIIRQAGNDSVILEF